MRKRRFVVLGGQMVPEALARVLKQADDEDDEERAAPEAEDEQADATPAEQDTASGDEAQAAEEQEEQAEQEQGGDKEEQSSGDERERQIAERLLEFFSNPWNQEGWNGPTLAHMAKTLLELVDKGVVEVPEDHPGLQAARDYARLWPDVEELGLHDYIMPWREEMVEELKQKAKQMKAEEKRQRTEAAAAEGEEAEQEEE